MASVATFGLSKIEIKKTEETEDQYKTLGMTYQDSCMLTQNEPEVIDHYAEESDVPVVSVSKGGKVLLTFSIMDADVDALVELMGGDERPRKRGVECARCQSDGGIEYPGNAQVGLADRDPPRFGGGQTQRQFFPFGAFPDHGYGDGVQGGGQAADHRPSETGRCVKGARIARASQPFSGDESLPKRAGCVTGNLRRGCGWSANDPGWRCPCIAALRLPILRGRWRRCAGPCGGASCRYSKRWCRLRWWMRGRR